MQLDLVNTLTNFQLSISKTNFDCQIDKKRVGLEMGENSLA
jgi:hypothetical protein